MGSLLVLADHEEPDTVGTTAIFLGVHLCLCRRRVNEAVNRGEECNLLSAIEPTSRFTGAGRLKSIREDMACCRIKLLQAMVGLESREHD